MTKAQHWSFRPFYLGVESDIAHVLRKDILDSSTSAAPFGSSEPQLIRGTVAPSLDFTKSVSSQLHCKYQRLTSFEDQVTSSKTVHENGIGIASHTRHYVEEDPGRPTVCFQSISCQPAYADLSHEVSHAHPRLHISYCSCMFLSLRSYV